MWDLIVIGTGGAAMAAGIEARSRGKSVLLVEHGRVGWHVRHDRLHP